MNQETFSGTKAATLVTNWAVRVMVYRVGASVVVVVIPRVFPDLRQRMKESVLGRLILSTRRLPVLVTESLRVGLYGVSASAIQCVSGRFSTAAHAGLFHNALGQLLLPQSLRWAVTPVPLSTDAIQGLLESPTANECFLSGGVGALATIAGGIPLIAKRTLGKEINGGAGWSLVQLVADAVNVGVAHIAWKWSLGKLVQSGQHPVKTIGAWLVCNLVYAGVSSGLDLSVGHFCRNTPPKQQLDDHPQGGVDFSSLNALELCTLADLFSELMNSPLINNNHRLHAASANADLLLYVSDVLKGAKIRKRKHNILAREIAIPADTNPAECPPCVFSREQTKPGDVVLALPCGHCILKKFEDSYELDLCVGCFPPQAIIDVPDDERKAMENHLIEFEKGLLTKWRRDVLLPEHLLDAPWENVATFALSRNLASATALALVPNRTRPTDGGVAVFVRELLEACEVLPTVWYPAML